MVSRINRSILQRTYQADWLSPRDFNNKHVGKRAFVIGGGSSITKLQESGFDFSLLSKEVTIGTNACYNLLTPTYLIFGDYYFWKHFCHEIIKVDCIKMAPENILKASRPPKTIILKRSIDVNQMIPSGFDTPFSFVNNTGVAALRAAFVFGCNPIYLIGMDIGTGKDGETHFHSTYKNDEKRKTPPARYKQFHSVFVSTIKAMHDRGREIYSCSEMSSLNEVIPYVPLTSLTF